MTRRIKVIAISGSTRRNSINRDLINAIAKLYSHQLDIKVFQGLTEIPHFNPDLDTDRPPKAVIEFRKDLNEANGILICTPEYAMGVPGTLKNAIDWTVSSMEFSHKPVALITASTAGQKGHDSLIETLKIIESDIPESSQLIISHPKTKVESGKITDPKTLTSLEKVIDSLVTAIVKKEYLTI